MPHRARGLPLSLCTSLMLSFVVASSALAQKAPTPAAAPPPTAQPAPVAPQDASQAAPAPSAPAPQQPFAAPPPQAQPAPQAYPQQAYPQQAYPQQQPYAAPQPYSAPYAQQPYVQQQPPAVYQQPYVAPPARPRPSVALLITGGAIFGGSYLIASSVAAGKLDDDHGYCYDGDCQDNSEWAPWLFLPIAGPFVAMAKSDDDGEGADGALWFLGMAEVVGAGLTIGGAIRYRNTKRAAEAAAVSWQLPHDRTLALDVSTSARMAGPTLRLTF